VSFRFLGFEFALIEAMVTWGGLFTVADLWLGYRLVNAKVDAVYDLLDSGRQISMNALFVHLPFPRCMEGSMRGNIHADGMQILYRLLSGREIDQTSEKVFSRPQSLTLLYCARNLPLGKSSFSPSSLCDNNLSRADNSSGRSCHLWRRPNENNLQSHTEDEAPTLSYFFV